MGKFKADDLAAFWLKAAVSGGVPSVSASFNVTGVVDDGVGRLTVTIATDFASVSWCCGCSVEMTATTYAVANDRKPKIRNASQAAGTVAIDCIDSTSGTNLLADPAAWHVWGFGVQ